MARVSKARRVAWFKLQNHLEPFLWGPGRKRGQAIQDLGLNPSQMRKYLRGESIPRERTMRRMADVAGLDWASIQHTTPENSAQDIEDLNHWNDTFCRGVGNRVRAFTQTVNEVFLFFQNKHPDAVLAYLGRGTTFWQAHILIPIHGRRFFRVTLTGENYIWVDISLELAGRASVQVNGELSVSILQAGLSAILRQERKQKRLLKDAYDPEQERKKSVEFISNYHGI